MVPEEMPLKALAAPVYLPIGIVAGIFDVFLVHPISEIPKAYDDTIEIVWETSYKGYVTYSGFVPLRIVSTPVIFSVDLFFRSLFDIGDNQPFAKPSFSDSEIERAIATKDTKSLKTWLQTCHSQASNYAMIRKVNEEFATNKDLFRISLNCLAYKYFQENEDYLIGKLGTDPTTNSTLFHVFATNKSAKGSAAVLQRLYSEELTPKQSRDYMNAIFAIGNKKEIDDLLKRVRKKRN